MTQGKCVVTGGAGFIGSCAARAMLERGWRVEVIDDLSTGSEENLRGLDGVVFRRGDVRDLAAMREACRGASCMLHLAARTSVPDSVGNPLAYHDVDATGTITALEACRREGVRRFVFSSSCAIYGSAAGGPVSEAAPVAPESPYAAAKLAAEEYCRSYGRAFGLEAVVLRYFNVYGPGQRPDLQYAAVVPAFISALKSGAKPVIYGSGLQTRDFVFVGDVAAANVLAAERPASVSGTYNIAQGRETTVIELLEAVAAAFGRKAEYAKAMHRPGDVMRSAADISLARRELGFNPATGLVEGIRRTVEWFIPRAGFESAPPDVKRL